ncbi:MAG: bifunctional 3-deoxy-7-phosphoheptulonate synthase/chorismate mutase type II [Muribaculaceae bacterium]|nr:bifunctional 3-deoxy-7-phosphoheptulonate synthase/chorismate mutase type II [Muribaculaceae bacterium]
MTIENLKPIFNLPADHKGPIVIAGPCSAESEEQTLDTARQLAEAGITIFRAGIWKPRTKPGGFEGRGKEALAWLRKVKEATGMQVATEIANRRHLEEALGAGIDAVWIGARTSANPFAVQEIADTLALLPEEKKESITVLVKNPVNPDLELWVGAIERIYGSGVSRIGAIHRGFSTYGKHIYRNQPRWAIPIELNRRIPELPIIFDPSHVGGSRALVATLAQQALDMNFEGLIIESHCNPDKALSDAAQQVTPGELSCIVRALESRNSAATAESLDDLRYKIDRLDDELLELLSKRMEVSREIGLFKRRHNLPVVQTQRYKALMEKRVADGERLDMSADFVRAILAAIHEESVRQQVELK